MTSIYDPVILKILEFYDGMECAMTEGERDYVSKLRQKESITDEERSELVDIVTNYGYVL